MSMYGITMSPRMMNDGSTTPACHGSKKTSISWRPRKYHGAFDGFGVRVGFAGSSSGASESSDHTSRTRIVRIEIRNSFRTRCGQVWTLSSPGPDAFLIGTATRLPAGAGTAFRGVAIVSAFLPLGAATSRPEERDEHEHEEERNGEHARAREDERQHDQDERADEALQLGWHGSERGTREPVAADAPEVDRHEEARDERDEDAVEDIEAEQRVRSDLAAAEEERARVVDVVETRDQLVARPL